MTEIVVLGVVALALLYFNSQSAAAVVPAVTPAVPVPLAAPVLGGAPVSGGYALVPPATSINGPAQRSSLSPTLRALLQQNPGAIYHAGTGQLIAANGTLITSIAPTSAYTPPPPPPPYVSGGISGTVGAGGNPFGSVVRPGLSSGTATTSIPTITPVIS